MREVTNPPGVPRVERTMLDRVIGWWDPVRGVKRLQARIATTMLDGAWDGASKSKRAVASWSAPNLSADAALVPDLPTLRDRSHDLYRNNPLATGAVKTVVTRVVGTGLAMQPAIDYKILGISRDQAEEWQGYTKQRWSMWADTPWCDISRRQNFCGLQRTALFGALLGGDALALLPVLPLKGRPSELAVQLVEADRVANPRGKMDTTRMVAGIELSEDGAPLRAHFLREHPGALLGATHSLDGEWVDFYGAQSGRRNILHLIDPERIGQTRGVPYLAPVMTALKQLGRYTEAEISAAVISAFFAVFIRHATGEGANPMESAATGQYQSSDSAKGSSWDGKLSSGLAVDLPPGAEIDSVAPGRPNQAFDPFVQAVLRQIGVALELPFEILIKHFTSSYTAARAALLDLGLFVRRVRALLESTICQPTYEEWLRIEVATGRIAAAGFFSDPLVRHAWSCTTWTGDAMGVLDPQREISATEKALELRLTTRQRETMLRDGSNWEDNLEQLAREEEAIDAAGLKAPAPVAPAVAPPVAQPDGQPATKPDGSDDDAET